MPFAPVREGYGRRFSQACYHPHLRAGPCSSPARDRSQSTGMIPGHGQVFQIYFHWSGPLTGSMAALGWRRQDPDTTYLVCGSQTFRSWRSGCRQSSLEHCRSSRACHRCRPIFNASSPHHRNDISASCTCLSLVPEVFQSHVTSHTAGGTMQQPCARPKPVH